MARFTPCVGAGEEMRLCLRLGRALAARGLEMARDAALPPPAPPVAPLTRLVLVSVAEMASPAPVEEGRAGVVAGARVRGGAYVRYRLLARRGVA